jgi:hypothetical protein
MDIWVGLLKFAFFVERFAWQNARFSPSVHFGGILANRFVSKLCVTIPNLIVEFNNLSRFFDLKSVNHNSRYFNFSAATPTKKRFHEKLNGVFF